MENVTSGKVKWSTRIAPTVTGFTRTFFSKGKANQSSINRELELETWTAV